MMKWKRKPWTQKKAVSCWRVPTLISAILIPSDIHNLHYSWAVTRLAQTAGFQRSKKWKDVFHSCFLTDKISDCITGVWVMRDGCVFVSCKGRGGSYCLTPAALHTQNANPASPHPTRTVTPSLHLQNLRLPSYDFCKSELNLDNSSGPRT